jgi:hypothetical protein
MVYLRHCPCGLVLIELRTAVEDGAIIENKIGDANVRRIIRAHYRHEVEVLRRPPTRLWLPLSRPSR